MWNTMRNTMRYTIDARKSTHVNTGVRGSAGDI